MDSNNLYYYLFSFAELVDEPPTAKQWATIRAAIFNTSLVEPVIVDSPPMHNPIPRPVIDKSKLPENDCGCFPTPPARQS